MMTFVNNLLYACLGPWRYYRFRQGLSLRKNIFPHYATVQSCQPVPKVVVCMVNGWTWTGGLADRLKGAVSVYDWCVRNNETFKLHFVAPFHLYDYLVSNEVNWYITDNDLCFNREKVNIQQFICDTTFLRVRQTKSNILQRIKEWENKYLKSIRAQTHVYTNLLYVENDFHSLFSQLFRPSERLQTEIDKYKGALGEDYISVSLRFATLLGDFEDCTGTPLPVAERQELIDSCMGMIEQIHRTAVAHNRILVTADSCTFISHVLSLPYVYVIPGKIGHIDYQHSDDVNMKSFLDFWFISQAKAVYQVRKLPMYGGEFSKTAAMAGGKPFEVVEG